MSKIIWIASYPKSGNTWLRFLACNLVFGEVDSAATLSRLAPDLHEQSPQFEPPAQLLLMKTHFPYTSGLRFAGQTAAAIYVLRDPADVMLSNFHYGLRSGAMAGDAAALFDRYVDAFIQSRGDPRWVKLGMGSWENNVHSWVDPQLTFPVLRLRYEDLLTDGMTVAVQLCRCLGITRSAEQQRVALAAASFERMREIEEADIRARRVGIFYKPYLQQPIDAGLRFMRSGGSGAGDQALSDGQRRRFNEAFGRMRQELGYR
jgi:hypothetical protein